MAKNENENSELRASDPWLLEDVYPSAQDIFAPYAPPEVSDESVIVALDTNALLLPYRMNPGNVGALAKVYQSLSEKKRLVVPARAVREFAKHRDNKLGELMQALNEQRKRFPSDQLPPLVQDMDGYQEAMQCLVDLKKVKDAYDKAMGQIIAGMKAWRGNDPVAKLYASVFTGDAIVDLPVDEVAQREELLKEARRRTASRIPPGYQDAGKEDEGIGDFLIWKSLLELGKARKQDLAFVTGEQKNDWFVRSGGEHVYPRFELVDEYRRASGGRSLRLMSLPQLLDALKAPASVVDDAKTAEAQSAAAERAAERQSARDAFKFIKLNDKIFVLPKIKPQAGTASSSTWSDLANLISARKAEGSLASSADYSTLLAALYADEVNRVVNQQAPPPNPQDTKDDKSSGE